MLFQFKVEGKLKCNFPLPYSLLFNSHLIYGCQIGDNNQGTELKKIEALQQKAIRVIKFLPNNAPVSKEMHS